MEIIEVIPLKRGAHIESLSYYSSTHYEIGTIIEVPVRKSNIKAIVINTKPVSAARTAVRAATFTLKKLPDQLVANPLPQSLIETAKGLQKIYPAHLGAILYHLLPLEVRDGTHQVEYTTPVSHAEIRPEIEVLQANFHNRIIAYRSKIREVFAHRGSVLLVVPTSAHIEQLAEELSHGIENRVVVFSPHHTKKKMEKAYASYYDLTSAKLIITTPAHAYLDRHDITHMIIEHSRSKHYFSRTRPYLDHREVIKILANVTNRTITFGDILPRAEEEFRRREEIYTTGNEQPKRLALPAKLSIITQLDKPTAEQPFQLFAPELIDNLKEALKKRQRVFMYAARRGLAPVVVCNDCGYIFRCPHSGAPYSLFKTMKNGEEERWFLSAVSGRRVRASDTCPQCGSWRLRERGIGIQYIERELRDLFPSTPITLFDHTTATTPKKAKILMGKFYDERSAILLGTQMAIPHLHEGIDTTIITSHDATRAIPSWRAEEEFFELLLQLRDITADTVYLQTRSEPDELLDIAAQGLVEQFYNEELELRGALKYPPYAHLVLLTWQDTRDNIAKTEAELEHVLHAFTPKFYSAPQSLREKTKRHCLIRIMKADWPDTVLMDRLRSLPPSIKIEIDPDRII